MIPNDDLEWARAYPDEWLSVNLAVAKFHADTAPTIFNDWGRSDVLALRWVMQERGLVD